MASITVRKLDNAVKERLRVRAAKAGHSMEEEVRIILTREADKGEAPRGLNGPEFLALMQSLFSEEHEELEIPPRPRHRPPIDLPE